MKILVTGGRGFIGRNLITKLVSLRHQVISLDRKFKPNTEVSGCEYIIQDINNISKIDGRDIDICFHLAAVHLDKTSSFIYPDETFNVITSGTQRVALWCIENNIKLIYSGTSSIFFNKEQSPYTYNKFLSENLLRSYQTFYNLKLDIVTIYNVYGKCSLTNIEGSNLLKKWKDSSLMGSVTIFGNGSQMKDFIYINDLVNALVLLLDNRNEIENWHLGTGTSYSLNELYKIFKIKFSNIKLEYKEVDNVDNSNHHLINDSFHKKFKWKPSMKLHNYIKEIL